MRLIRQPSQLGKCALNNPAPVWQAASCSLLVGKIHRLFGLETNCLQYKTLIIK